jgi:hypothetical protein
MLDDVELRELRIFLAVLVAAMRETGAQRSLVPRAGSSQPTSPTRPVPARCGPRGSPAARHRGRGQRDERAEIMPELRIVVANFGSVTDTSSPQFEASHANFNSGATRMIQGLNGMGSTWMRRCGRSA